MHKPILFKDVGLFSSKKQFFSDFNANVLYGSRIAIIGRNGVGKSTLLKMIQGEWPHFEGNIFLPDNVHLGYLPQVIDFVDELSGGERLNYALSGLLCCAPNLLLLDEPTNHLDGRNRHRLIRMLQSYSGTLIVVSHDIELLRGCIDTLWHIENGMIRIFSGGYEDYKATIQLERDGLENDLKRLNRQKKGMHDKLMQEQKRSAKSREKGEKKVACRKWLKAVGDLKGMKAEKSQGKKFKDIDETKRNVTQKLAGLCLSEEIVPKFLIHGQGISKRALIQISDGAIEYFLDRPLLSNISLTVSGHDRIALLGDNGSGKSSLVKALLGDETVKKKGHWVLPSEANIGYLDQHYQNLAKGKTVLEMLASLMPRSTSYDLRAHLNHFLFRKNEEVETIIDNLSEGEKARLSLCCIAAKTPALLILDEITNNLDLETRAHVIHVLRNYPGAMIVISHDNDFLKSIEIQRFYRICQGRLECDSSLDLQ